MTWLETLKIKLGFQEEVTPPSYVNCKVCGLRTRSKVGVCQRNRECSREYQRLYKKDRYNNDPEYRRRHLEMNRRCRNKGIQGGIDKNAE